MTKKQLLKIMENIDTAFEEMTAERYDELIYGDGLYTVLENAVDSVISNNSKFWQNIFANDNYVCYTILDKYFWAKSGQTLMKFTNSEVQK